MRDERLIQSLGGHLPDLQVIESHFSKSGGWNSFIGKLWHFWRNYIGLAFAALRSSKRNDTLITWQVFVGVTIGLMIRMFKINRRLVILSFIYRPRTNRLVNKLRFTMTRLGLSAASIVVCYSSHEERVYSDIFSLPNTRFRFVRLGKTFTTGPCTVVKDTDRWVFSAGQSNRDYVTLIEAMRNVNARLTIATTNNVAVPPDLSYRVVVELLEGPNFLSTMAMSSLVVLPLEDTDYSSGQIVLINAMALGKCIVITETKWTRDYVVHGENVWLVKPKDPEALSSSINLLLHDQGRRETIAHNAKECYENHFNGREFGRRIADLLQH